VNQALRTEVEERGRAEQQKEQYFQDLLRSQKLEAPGGLAGAKAHAILGSAEDAFIGRT
jgi:hypothetical protein